MGTEKAKAPKIKVEHYDDLMGYNPYAAAMEVREQEAGFHYRWVRNTPAQIHRREMMGFDIVGLDEAKTLAPEANPEGRHRVGGLVLMRQPEELHEQHVRLLRKRAFESKRSTIERFKGKAAQTDVGGGETVQVIDQTKITRGTMAQVAGEGRDR